MADLIDNVSTDGTATNTKTTDTLKDTTTEERPKTKQDHLIDYMTEEFESYRQVGQGYEGAQYNALIDKYEKMTADEVVLASLRVLHDMTENGKGTAARSLASDQGLLDLYEAYENAENRYATEQKVADQKTVSENLQNMRKELEQDLTDLVTGNANNHYYIPVSGDQVETANTSMYQANPLLKYYSPRLLGAPPQLTNLCDMRLLSAYDENTYGPVGDFYLTKILQQAQVCNFFVGKARFTGGTGSILGIINQAKNYFKALKAYDIYGNDSTTSQPIAAPSVVQEEVLFESFDSSIGDDNSEDFGLAKASSLGLYAGEEDPLVANITDDTRGIIDSISESLIVGGGLLTSQILTSLSVQQPFYTFEADWLTYINNVKMMINTAVIMLGLQKAPVRIGEELYPIGMNVRVKDAGDVWANYRYITPTEGLGQISQRENMTGTTSQYVSFMVDPSSFTESYQNDIGESQLFSGIKTGQGVGNEIAFLTNASVSKLDDAIINLAQKGTNAAEALLSSLGGGVGRFTAGILGGFAKSFTGDHTIYPQIWQDSKATQSVSFTIHLVSDAGDPYSYLINILVPLFYLMGMALPKLSRNNAAAYAFPPVVQVNVPGLWGTRLGMITSLTVTKNPNGGDVSVNGYPLSVDVQVQIADLQHVLMTSPMNQVSTFLNNNTMFDYIAQCCGCDKYRVNPAVRLVSKLALAASFVRSGFDNIGDAIMSGANSWLNRKFGYSSV